MAQRCKLKMYISRSSKVISQGHNRKRVYGFLLDVNSYLRRRTHHLRDTGVFSLNHFGYPILTLFGYLLFKLPQIYLSPSKRYDTKSTTRTIFKMRLQNSVIYGLLCLPILTLRAISGRKVFNNIGISHFFCQMHRY